MYFYNTLINAGMNSLTNFITGSEIKAVSENEKSAKFLNDYLFKKRALEAQLNNAILKTNIAGNGYIEVDYASDGLPDKFYSIADPSRIYCNFDKYGRPKTDAEAYIQRVDPIYNEPDARWYELSYHIGYSYHKIRLRGIPIPFMKLVHFKGSESVNGVYGRSAIAAGINDNEVLGEIEKAMAMIARYRAVPKKIISYGDKEFPADTDEVDRFAMYLENLQTEENAITNKPFKMEDLSYSGKDINLEYPLKHVKKKLIAGIIPEFMVGMAEDINMGTARHMLTAFLLDVNMRRKNYKSQIERLFFQPIIKRYGLAEDTHLEFGKLEFEDAGEKTDRVAKMWTANMITLNEARKEIGSELGALSNGGVFYNEWSAKLTADASVLGAPQGVQDSPAAPQVHPMAKKAPPENPYSATARATPFSEKSL